MFKKSPFSNNQEFRIRVLFIYGRMYTFQLVSLNGMSHISFHYYKRLVFIVPISNGIDHISCYV